MNKFGEQGLDVKKIEDIYENYGMKELSVSKVVNGVGSAEKIIEQSIIGSVVVIGVCLVIFVIIFFFLFIFMSNEEKSPEKEDKKRKKMEKSMINELRATLDKFFKCKDKLYKLERRTIDCSVELQAYKQQNEKIEATISELKNIKNNLREDKESLNEALGEVAQKLRYLNPLLHLAAHSTLSSTTYQDLHRSLITGLSTKKWEKLQNAQKEFAALAQQLDEYLKKFKIIKPEDENYDLDFQKYSDTGNSEINQLVYNLKNQEPIFNQIYDAFIRGTICICDSIERTSKSVNVREILNEAKDKQSLSGKIKSTQTLALELNEDITHKLSATTQQQPAIQPYQFQSDSANKL